MPLYEYACQSCDHHFDVRHGANEKPALSCPQCHGEVRKVFHAAGIIFKGSGWYITDHAKKSGITETNTEKDEKVEKTEGTEQSAKSETSEKKEPVAVGAATAEKSTETKSEPGKG